MEQKKTEEVAWPEPSMKVGDVDLWDAQAVRQVLELHGIRGDSSHVWERDGAHLVELDADTPVVISAADLRSQLMMKPNVRSLIERCRDFIDSTQMPRYPASVDLADEIDRLFELDDKAGTEARHDEACARNLFNAGWCAAALFCDRDDVLADGDIGGSGCPQFENALALAKVSCKISPKECGRGNVPSMDEAVTAGDGTLHGAIDHWQERAHQAEAMFKQLASDAAQFMAPLAWAVVVGGEVHSVRRFEPRATDEPGGAVFVPLFPPSPISQDREGWLREGALVYRLTDERRPRNRDEVSVTMADGSHHDKEARVRLAKKIHEFLAQPEPAFDWDNSQAFSEGWGVFTVDGRFLIQRSDERGYFATDAMAMIHVAHRAHHGSSYHLQALEMVGTLATDRQGQ